jgi:hypothetical protein
METESGYLSNCFIQPKQVTQHSMQPLYATAYENGVSPPKIPRTAAQATQALGCLISIFQPRACNLLPVLAETACFNP